MVPGDAGVGGPVIVIGMDPVDDEVVRYLVENYAHLLTPVERSALRASRAAARQLLRGAAASRILEMWVEAAPPEATALTEGGERACMRRLAERLWRDASDQLVFNTCPQCGRLARTPTTKLCQQCWHDWH